VANFIAIVDPNPDRRSNFIHTVQSKLSIVQGLVTNSCFSGDFYIAWAAYPQAPISYATVQDSAAIVFGEAIIQGSTHRINATDLQRGYNSSTNKVFPTFDGFHSAIVYEHHFGLTVSSDLLGLFPIYYFAKGEVVIVASSPELIQYHPLFEAEFNPKGLIGILLTNGLFDGQTLWKSVKRLQAGYVLQWKIGQFPCEIKQYDIFKSGQVESYLNLSFSESLEVLDQVTEQAIKRHTPSDQLCTLLLSGGIDSRMLAGYLQQQGVNPVTLTFGVDRDFEMQCALPVAHALKLKHYKGEIPVERYPEYTDLWVRWEHLGNGGNTLKDWAFQSYLKNLNLPPRVISGRAMGPIAGNHLDWSYSSTSKSWTFESLFARFNRWGFSPEVLTKLLREEVFGQALEETLARIREVYQNYSDTETERIWSFYVYHRDRYHIGAFAWQLSFGAWPILPILDWNLLQATAILSPKVLGFRKAQTALLESRFPKLAELPLDRNSFNTEPLVPSRFQRKVPQLHRFTNRLQQKWRKYQHQRGVEQRYYYRIYDINNSGWQAIRDAAEAQKKEVNYLFNSEVLNELLPSPEVRINLQGDQIVDASGRKSLLGFLLWAKHNL
jgi:asparagine synthase (glutamine-hydrolysing)